MTSLETSNWARIASRLSPADFASYVSKGLWKFTPHLDFLNKRLIELCSGDGKGLVINMPPRHGKSELCSRYLPAWYLGTNPEHRILLAGHEGRFAAKWGRKARDLIEAHGEAMWDVMVRRDSHAADSWNLAGHEGGMDTAGVSGSLTGKGAHLFVADDLIKGPDMANSAHQRDKAWETILTCMETRLEPGGRIIVIQTRWHEDDPAGRIIRQIEKGERPDWDTCIFPAIAEEHDLLGREIGEALWPDRFDKEYLEALHSRWDHDEARLGAYWWDALYQQRPSPREGGLFKRQWLRYFKESDHVYELTDKMVPKDDVWKIFTCDLAVSQKETADYCYSILFVNESPVQTRRT